VRKQDEQQYVEYVTVKLPELRRLALSLCKDRDRADDVVQAAITKLYVHWHRARSADSIDAYVRTIVVRTFLNEQKLRWAKVWLTGEEPPNLPSPPGREVETRMVVDAALGRIPPRQRAVLVLRFLYDQSIADVARMLDCSEGNVKSLTSTGLARLRQLLGTPELVVPGRSER
jgi:RNA polymerase sigma-70 factor (sigma-E family)